jgi:hypothetical protein
MMKTPTVPRPEQIQHTVPKTTRDWVAAVIREEVGKIPPTPPAIGHQGEIENLKRRLNLIEQYLEDDKKYSLTRPKLVRLLKEMGHE